MVPTNFCCEVSPTGENPGEFDKRHAGSNEPIKSVPAIAGNEWPSARETLIESEFPATQGCVTIFNDCKLLKM